MDVLEVVVGVDVALDQVARRSFEGIIEMKNKERDVQERRGKFIRMAG